MESLLTISLGEYSSVEIALQLVVVLIGMTAVLLALTASTLPTHLRFPLFLSAVALAGAAWFESGLWQSWKEAFELAGTSYCVTGHLIADEDRIIAWSLGVPAILCSYGLIQIPWRKRPGFPMESISVATLAMALIAPFSTALVIPFLAYAGFFLLRNGSLRLNTATALICMLFGTAMLLFHPSSLGGGPSGELVRGEILRALIDILSLVIPALLLLTGALRLSKADQQKNA